MNCKLLSLIFFLGLVTLGSAQNLALNMPVTVTSTESAGLIGENAVDGSMSTRWSSAFSEPHSISVDLGDIYDLDRVVIHWEGAYAVAYDVEVSTDGIQWTVANSVNTGNGGEDVVSLTGNTGRYVRIQCLQRVFIGGTQYGFSIYELEVYGLAPANSALLQDIFVDGMPLSGFQADSFNYAYDVTDTSTSIPSLTAIAANAQASVVINNVTSLPGLATILVNSADQSTTETYTILFQRVAYTLVWNDEFDYNGAVDPSKWFHQTYPPFGGGWANAEEQHYTDRLTNSFVDNGSLKIIANREQYQDPVVGSTKSFTSARLNSKYAFQYGRVEVRAKLPAELGTWPAIWTLGQNVNEQGAYWQTQGFGQVSWPFCGEIDIMEQSTDKNTTSGAFHFPDANGTHTYTYSNTPVANSATTWHNYSMEWTEDAIILMVDDVVFHTLDNAANPYFDNPHYLLLNIAMGGSLGGAIPQNFTSSEMEIDFVRVYQRALLPPDSILFSNQTGGPNPCIEVSPSADTLCAGESTTLTASFSDSRWQNYYVEDFESGVSSEWTSTSTFSYEGSQLLGRYGNNNIALNLSNLPAHDSVRVEFDLFIGDTWDGYSLLGGTRDIWRLRFNGDTIINATFAACCGSQGNGNGGQSYPDNIPAVNPATTGAFALDLPDFVGSGDGTDLYKVSRSSDDTSSSLTVEFSAQDLQSLNDESWAIDNVRVYLYSSDVVNDVIWSTGDTALSITVSPSTTTTYYATLNDGLSLCLDSAVVEVISLSVDLGADTLSFCDTVTTLDAGPGYGSYLWSTGETTQTIDVDSSGMYSVTVGDTIGVVNSHSLSFDGVSDFVDCGQADNVDILSNNASWMAWVSCDDLSNNMAIASKWVSGGNSQWAIGRVDTQQSEIYLTLRTANGSYNQIFSSGYNFQPNEWTHVAAIWTGDSISFYKNGLLVSTAFVGQFSLNPTTGNLLIGAQENGIGFNWDGEIANFSNWNRALSSSEIQQYMNCPPTGSEAGLVGYWNFEEGTGSVVNDLSGNGNNGTINGASWSTDVPNQTCIGCTATDSVYVDLFQAEIVQEDTTICFGDSVTLNAGGLGSGGSTSSRCDLPSNLQNGLVGYWPFCGNANDESGNGNDGVVNGATLTSDRFGNANSAYDFDGVDDGIIASVSSLPLGNSDRTISVWVYDLSFGDYCSIPVFYGTTAPANGCWINTTYGNCSPSYNNGAIIADFYWPEFLVSTATMQRNQWRMITISLENQNCKIFLDTTLIAEGMLSINTISDMANQFYIGAVFGNLNTNYNGFIDDVGLWNRALSPQEVVQLHNNQGVLTYSWSTGDTTASIDVSPSQTTTYSVTVSNGISSCTDSVTVTVSNQPPIITCLTDITTVSSTDGTGDCSTTVVIGNPGVSDDCDVPVLTAEINGSVVDVNTYAFPVGTTTITWIATDGQGLADTCYQDIHVLDDEDPVLISCPLGIQVDNDPGDCGAIVTFVEPVFSDNCSFQVNSPALGSGSFFPIGLTNLTYTVIDSSGNQESCTVAVIVDDVERPVFLECPGDTTISTDALSCSASFSFPSAIVSDNCPNTSLQQLGLPSGANFPLGSSVVTFIVNDTSGNRDTCSFTVTVVDSVAPYFTSCPSDINIELGTQSCDTVVSWSSLSAFDNCSAMITQINGLPSGSVFPVGSTLNRFVVADNAGNTDTCSFTVTVTDNKPPVIVCPPPTIVNNVGSNCGPQVINYSLPTSTDNCVTVTTTRIAGPASGSVFPVGTTTVTYVATDNVGNTDTCSFTVTINDPLPPPASVDSISGPIEMCKNTGSFYSVNAASNATDYLWTVIGGDINPLAVGTTSRNKQITWQTSGIGMIIVEAVNTCYGSTPDTLEVMVYDIPSPVDAGLDSTTLCSPLSSYTLQATPPAIGNGVWSVVLGGGTIVSPNSPISLVTGLSTDSNLFRWTVTNAICTRTDSIYVIPDIEAPTATCQDITRFLPPAGFINLGLSEVVLSTADNCAVDSVWLVQSVFTCVDLGTATAEVMVSDSFGNLGGCTANVTLIDTIKPTAICQDITVVLNSLGEYTLNAQEVNGGSFDNCSLDSVYIDRSFFTCADTGIHQVMLTVVDLSGYRDSCMANVTVLDTAGPAINGCVDRTVFLDSSGVVVVDPNILFLSIPNDPCGLASITTNVNQNIFTCEDAGPNTVVVTATDNNGNQSTCSSTVTVIDNIAPLAICSDINVTLDSIGSYTILDANVFDAGSYDACGITTWVASPTTFTCSDTGSNIVTVTIYDSLGNTSTCTPSVNVSSNFSSTLDTTVCGGIVWNGSYYDSPGTYTYNTASVTGCDSVALLNLTLYPAFTVSDSARGCDSVVVNGNVYFSSQVVVDSFVTADGCDSIVTTDVIIDPTRYGVDVKAICNSYTWVDGQTYTASTNTPTFTYTAANGCDSIITLNLTILNSTSDSVSATACDSFTWNGTTYYQSGGYTYQTQNAVGCDSTATLLLTINNPTSSTTSISSCNDYTWNGVTYQQSGTYTYQTQNANGCDSTATLVLTINSPTSSQESVTSCDSFIWNGVTYEQSGTYTYQTQNANGCDSTATLVLTINNSTSSQESVTACDSYQWNGVTYQQSATYTYQTQNANGCDSMATLVLTINNSTSSQENVTACDSYSWNGVNYQQSGTYTYQTQNANGCDSTATLNLTINSSNSGVEVASACESYTWIDGNTYLSDTFGPTFTLSNASGCDSVVTLDLTIRNTSSRIDTVTYCGVYAWLDSNQYSTDTFGPTVTYTNSVGCDSIVTLFLTIEPLNTVISVTQAFTLSAQQDNGTYQWIDCNNHNAPIPGETNQSYSPVETGLYAVIITANGCTDTSACVSQQGSGVGILESTLPSEVYLYPNPFADELHLELGQYYGSIRLVMYNMIGQTIYSQQYNGVNRIDPTMDVAAGTYTLRLEDDQGRYAMFRIVRKH